MLPRTARGTDCHVVAGCRSAATWSDLRAHRCSPHASSGARRGCEIRGCSDPDARAMMSIEPTRAPAEQRRAKASPFDRAQLDTF
ncbi:hypothetical protein FGB62_218g012 [Gracilaria domingensis]|nr:hypothetical protein FGB62_468g03 [Gracilaria domingensis]KAI0556748.1 hypothetical protein FGB62_412g04 [Gracilaria domingensis]KAI0558310.1 hypothetical protein FGB62_218g012 [Gracilaria domingensis]